MCEPSSSTQPASGGMESTITIVQVYAELHLLLNDLATISDSFGTVSLLEDERPAASRLKSQIEILQTILHPRNRHALDEQEKAKSGVFVLRAWLREVFPFLKKTREVPRQWQKRTKLMKARVGKNTESRILFAPKTPTRNKPSTIANDIPSTPTYDSSDDDVQIDCQESPSAQQKDRLMKLEETKLEQERDADLEASWLSDHSAGKVKSGLNDSNVAFDPPAQENTVEILEGYENPTVGLKAKGQPKGFRAIERLVRFHSATLNELLDAKSSGDLHDPNDLISYDPTNTMVPKTFISRPTIYANGFQHSTFSQQRSGYEHIRALADKAFLEGLKTFTRWAHTSEGVLGGTVRCKNDEDILNWSLLVAKFLETRDGAFEADLKAALRVL